MVNTSEFLKPALAKLAEGKSKPLSGAHENAMKAAVADTLELFCTQDGEFAQAVAQGGTFQDCMKAVAHGVHGSISDIDAYRRAVRFYFPGAEVEMQMVIHVNPYRQDEPEPGGIVLSLSDFF